MSFEDPPQRPRSTPIPDSWGAPSNPSTPGRSSGQHPGQQSSGPNGSDWPTAAWPAAGAGGPADGARRTGDPNGPATQFAPPESAQPTGQFQMYGAAIPVKALTRIWIARSVVAVIVTAAGLGFAWYVYRDSQKKVDQVLSSVPTFTIPQIVVPTFTVPNITVAGVPLPTVAPITVPDLSLPGIPLPSIAGPDGSIAPITVPVPISTPPASEPPALAPGPTASLYDPVALSQLIDQFEQIMPGEPTQFTQIVLYPSYAIASAQDPTDPTNTFGVLWRDGAVTAMPGLPVQDIDTHRFAATDVDWPAIAGLVAQAPQLMSTPAGSVSHVIVLRSDFDPTVPIRVLVYVDEAGGYIEADATGVVVATH